MMCKVTAPKRQALNLRLGRQILVAPGETQSFDLTGDEVGAVEQALAQIHRENNVPEKEQGSISCPERDDFEPAVGSKAHRLAHPDEYVGGVHKGDRAGLKAAKAEAEKAAASKSK